jgi:hypothetical protein
MRSTRAVRGVHRHRIEEFKIYLNADDGTTATEIYQKMVRDYNYRGSDAQSTYYQWDKVKRNELESIEAFRDTADIKSTPTSRMKKPYSLSPPSRCSRCFRRRAFTNGSAAAYQSIVGSHPIPVTYVPINSLLQEFIKL